LIYATLTDYTGGDAVSLYNSNNETITLYTSIVYGNSAVTTLNPNPDCKGTITTTESNMLGVSGVIRFDPCDIGAYEFEQASRIYLHLILR